MSQTPFSFLWIKNAFEFCIYYNICIKRNSLHVCECEENLQKQISTWFIAEEHVKISGRLNSGMIINCLTKASFKILVSILIFGRLIKGKLRRLSYKAFIITTYFIRPNKNMFLCIINERTSPIYSLTDTHAMLYCLLVIPIFCMAYWCVPTIASNLHAFMQGYRYLAVDLALWKAYWYRK